MRIAVELAKDPPAGGWRVRLNPTCRMGVEPWNTNDRCGKPATVRVNHWPYWSMFWCPEHAQFFADRAR